MAAQMGLEVFNPSESHRSFETFRSSETLRRSTETAGTSKDTVVRESREILRDKNGSEILLKQYTHQKEKEYLQRIRDLIGKDLSEPYSIYVYRYFLNNWPDLCWMVLNPQTEKDPKTQKEIHNLWGVVICKLEPHRSGTQRGYIAMLAVEESQRKCGLGTILVQKAIDTMTKQGADEVVLETEDVNKGSQKLYQRLGFLPTKHLHRYYLNGNGALRLALYLTDVKKKILQRPSPGSAASFSKDQYGQYQGYPHNEGGYGEGQYDDDLYG